MTVVYFFVANTLWSGFVAHYVLNH